MWLVEKTEFELKQADNTARCNPPIDWFGCSGSEEQSGLDNATKAVRNDQGGRAGVLQHRLFLAESVEVGRSQRSCTHTSTK